LKLYEKYLNEKKEQYYTVIKIWRVNARNFGLAGEMSKTLPRDEIIILKGRPSIKGGNKKFTDEYIKKYGEE